MKNSIFIILATLFIVICIICVMLINLESEKKQIVVENRVYTKYKDQEIIGTELATLIGRAIAQNEENDVPKDEKGYYIDNKENSIKIDLKMKTIEKTYPMEEIYNNEIAEFVQNFNTIKFKCIEIQYHKKTNRVSKLVFEELQ